MTEIELKKSADDMKQNSTIKLTQLIRAVLELKTLAMYPHSTSLAREKLYNELTYLENLLVELKDINVELERDWWKE